jgi:hypothetical protein
VPTHSNFSTAPSVFLQSHDVSEGGTWHLPAGGAATGASSSSTVAAGAGRAGSVVSVPSLAAGGKGAVFTALLSGDSDAPAAVGSQSARPAHTVSSMSALPEVRACCFIFS